MLDVVFCTVNYKIIFYACIKCSVKEETSCWSAQLNRQSWTHLSVHPTCLRLLELKNSHYTRRMAHFVQAYITHVVLSYPLLCHTIQAPQLTICSGHEPFQTLVEEEQRREWTDNPWSGQGLLSQWSRVFAHISWLLPGCLLTAISTMYSSQAHVGQLWTA